MPVQPVRREHCMHCVVHSAQCTTYRTQYCTRYCTPFHTAPLHRAVCTLCTLHHALHRAHRAPCTICNGPGGVQYWWRRWWEVDNAAGCLWWQLMSSLSQKSAKKSEIRQHAFPSQLQQEGSECELPGAVRHKHCTLNTALSSVHSAHCTLHTAHCTLHTAHYILRTRLWRDHQRFSNNQQHRQTNCHSCQKCQKCLF